MNRLLPANVPRAAGEVVVVVLGILIAFGLDSWWDSRKQDRWEHTQLESLHGEFSKNLVHLDEVILSHEDATANIEKILTFTIATLEGQAAGFADSTIIALIGWRTSEISMGVLDALLASGDLGRLSDSLLRSKLTAWKAQVLDAQEKEVLARDFVEFVLTPALLNEEMIANAYAARPPYADPLIVEHGTSPVIASNKLRGLASARLGHIRLALHSQRLVRDEVREIMAFLETHLPHNQANPP